MFKICKEFHGILSIDSGYHLLNGERGGGVLFYIKRMKPLFSVKAYYNRICNVSGGKDSQEFYIKYSCGTEIITINVCNYDLLIMH